MFNVGGGELIVIMLIALIVLGPERLPGAARQLGKTIGDLRRLSTGFQSEMKQALDVADDPTRVAARRNVLASDAHGQAAEVTPAADAIAAVSAQPVASGEDSAPAAPKKRPRRTVALTAKPDNPQAPAVLPKAAPRRPKT